MSLFSEISKIQSSGRIPPRVSKFVDLYNEKKIQVVVNVLVPVKEHPKVSTPNQFHLKYKLQIYIFLNSSTLLAKFWALRVNR